MALVIAVGASVLFHLKGREAEGVARRREHRLNAENRELQRRFEEARSVSAVARSEVDRLKSRPTEADLERANRETAERQAEILALRQEIERNAETISSLLRRVESAEAAAATSLGDSNEAETAAQQLVAAEARIVALNGEVAVLNAALAAAREAVESEAARIETARLEEAPITATTSGDGLRERLLGDMESELRRGGAASSIVRRFGDSDITLELLTDFLGHRDLASRALLAAAALESVSMAWVVERIERHDVIDRQAAGEAILSHLKRGGEGQRTLREVLRHQSSRVRHAAARAAFMRRDHEGVRLLLELLADDDEEVATAAADLLLRSPLLGQAVDYAISRIAAGQVPDAPRLLRALLEPDLAPRVLPRLSDVAWTNSKVEGVLAALIDDEDMPEVFKGATACGELLPLAWRDPSGEWMARLERLLGWEALDDVAARRARFLTEPSVLEAGAVALSKPSGEADDALEVIQLMQRATAAELAGGIDDLRRSGGSRRMVSGTLARLSSSWLASGAGDRERGEVAASLLARQKDPRAVKSLLEIVGRVSPRVRAEIAHELSVLGHPRGLATLRDLVRVPSAGQEDALRRLVDLGTPEAIRTAEIVMTTDPTRAVRFLGMLDERKKTLREDAMRQFFAAVAFDAGDGRTVFGHAERVWGSATRGRVGELLLSGAMKAEAAAIRYLAIEPEIELLPIYSVRLGHADVEIRTAAVEAVGRLAPRNVLPQLLELVYDEEPRVRRALADALSRVGEPAARGALVVLTKDEAWFVREAAVKALPDQPDGKLLIPTLKGRLSDDVDEVKNAARMALLRLGDSEHVGELIDDLEKEHLANRTRRFLEQSFKRTFDDAASWRAWWETHGRIEFEELQR